MLELPIEVIELHLTEFHNVRVLIEKPLKHILLTVYGKTEVSYPAVFLLFFQVVIDAVRVVEIGIYIDLAYIMEQIEVEMIDAAFFKLFRKYPSYFIYICEIVSGKFVGKKKAVSRISRQEITGYCFRCSVMVASSRVEIVYSPFYRGIEHHRGGILIRLRKIAVFKRKTHRSEAESGNFLIFETSVYHILSPFDDIIIL